MRRSARQRASGVTLAGVEDGEDLDRPGDAVDGPPHRWFRPRPR